MSHITGAGNDPAVGAKMAPGLHENLFRRFARARGTLSRAFDEKLGCLLVQPLEQHGPTTSGEVNVPIQFLPTLNRLRV